MNEPTERGHRAIKSYVLRQGRLTPGQERALAESWPRYGLDYLGTPRDLDHAFGRSAPKILEIGFGNGEALLAAAQSDPDRDYLGIEVHRPGVGRLLLNASKAAISNLRVYHHDAVEVLDHEIADASLTELRLYFPDPWHKARHNKRRMVQPGFVERVARKLQPGAMFHLATDWAAYAEHMLDVMEAAPGFRNRLGARAVAPRPDWRIETHFQKRGERLGHGVFDLIYDFQG
jgi:tRNA (guanine-N7-)-methyltransferase